MCSAPISDRAAQRGVALIEVIVFIVVLGVAVGAILSVFGNTNRGSAELLMNREAMSYAEAMLNEVLAAPFTNCDPQDTKVLTAATPGACNSMPEVLPGGPEAGESRYGPSYFDNVNDYNGFTMGPGLVDRSGVAIPGSALYSLRVDVSPVVPAVPLPGTWNGVPGTEMALVTVTVSAQTLTAPVILQGMAARIAPNALAP
jgi:MSHA pilin protein MshD